jgi:hypothetical protein
MKIVLGSSAALRRRYIVNISKARLGKGWTRLSEHLFRVDKWNVCRG